MPLSYTEVRRAIELAKIAFPRLEDWEYSNTVDHSYSGFTMWGEFVPDPNEPMPRTFFITFDTHGSSWAGHLTIGKHSYYWSSADCGDANLIDTHHCASLDEAITELKKRMNEVFAALSGRTAHP